MSLRTRILVAIGGLALMPGCGGDEVEERVDVVRPVRVMTVGVAGGGRLTFPGTVQGAERAILSFRVSGPLIEFPVDEGDIVEQGQLLARIDPRNFEIAVAEAKAAFEQGNADAQRYQRLYEKEAVPLADVELARARRDVAEARYDQTKADLSYTYLSAPFSGRVGRKYVENFERVEQSAPIVSLHNVANVEIVVDVPEHLVAAVPTDEGQALIHATFDAAPGKEFPLAFKEVAAEADPQTRTYAITLTMPQPDEVNVLPGMTALVVARADPTTGEADPAEFTIPATAVFGGDDGVPRVWVVDPATNTVHRREIQIGSVTGTDQVWVLGGLVSGEKIALVGVNQLQEGTEIRPQEGKVQGRR